MNKNDLKRLQSLALDAHLAESESDRACHLISLLAVTSTLLDAATASMREAVDRAVERAKAVEQEVVDARERRDRAEAERARQRAQERWERTEAERARQNVDASGFFG